MPRRITRMEYEPLTKTETLVHTMSQSMKTKHIAEALGLTPLQVKAALRRIDVKLGRGYVK